MPALLLLTGPSAGSRYDLVQEATLGRSPSCEIPLEDSKVSRRHAKIVVENGQTKISDLGSRNGTVVNGEKIEAEAILLPGDRFQIGETTALYEPPTQVSLADMVQGETVSLQVEEILPHVGPEASLLRAGISLISATSEAMVLRRGVEELARCMSAEKAGALLGGTEGLLTAAMVGADRVEVPRAMARGALERRETSRSEGKICAPLTASGGSAFGVLYAERADHFSGEDQRVVAALGRLIGEALATVRSSAARAVQEVVLVGGSRPFRKVVEQARRSAANSEHLSLYGEAGTGKSLLAEYIHSRSGRALGPRVVVDCRHPAAVIDELLLGRPSAPGTPPLSSALLRADGGTLILTHLEHLPRSAARAMAGFLLRKSAPSRGGGEEQVDVRLITTSHLPPELLVSRGETDPELGKILKKNEIEVLPLRERRQDIVSLFEYFTGLESALSRKPPPTLSPDARRLLEEYSFPGNVLELRQVSERAGFLYPGAEVPALRLPPEVQEGTAEPKPKQLQDMISRLERDAIAEALREARGKKIRAAAILGISRPTLDKKIEDYGLVVEKLRRV